MKYSNWEIKCRYPSDLLSEIVKSRSIENLDEFLNINYQNLSSTKKLKNISQAIKRIKKSIDDKKTIGVFCDYDADGVCSGAIMKRAIEVLGGETFVYVPERKEGYSLNNNSVDKLIGEKVDLVITLDCGIKNHEEIDRLLEASVETIIVDHHQLPDELPNAYAIVHPDLTTDSKSLELSGGGTAYMVARELLDETGREKWLIDLAAISSVADIVPLNHDNRILVKYGMDVLQKTKNIGLKKLLEVSGLTGKSLNTYDLGFAIAPRLNAAGRVAHPHDSYELLTTKSEQKALELAKKLDKYNTARQDMLSKSIEEAVLKIEAKSLDKQKMIILEGEWDEGIVGLIASRITDKYYKPSVVLSTCGDFLKGSARSIEGINITDAIGKGQENLISYGGHSQAAGLSLDKDKLNDFKKAMAKAAEKFNDKAYLRKLVIDALVKHADLSIKNISSLDKLAPFGPGNKKPILCLKGISIQSIETIGRDKTHQKIIFKCDDQDGCLLVFSYEKKQCNFRRGKKFDIAFSACVNEFRGNKKVDLILEDAKEIS